MKRLLIIPLLFLSLTLGATKIYIDDDGNDGTGDGTSSSPYLTLAYACTQASSGDTIYVNEGSYTINTQVIPSVQISIYSTDSPTFVAGDALNPMIYFYSATEGTDGNQIIEGINFDGDDTGVVGVQVRARSNVTIRNCSFIDFTDNAVKFSGRVSGDGAPTT